jgi:hypothetical protein
MNQTNKMTINNLDVMVERERQAVAQQTMIQALHDSVSLFKSESLTKHSKNNQLIGEFRDLIKEATNEFVAQYHIKINALEQKNEELKGLIENYSVEGRAKWISFKHEFNHHMCCLEKAINELSVENEL